MKCGYRRLWVTFKGCCFIVLAISVATSGRRAQGASEIAQKPQKNPKLSTQLVLLSRSVKQETERPAVAGAVSAPAGFSKEALPKVLRDAIRAGQMQVTKTAEVLTYIEVSETNPQNLSELRNLGVTIQIIGNSKPDKTKGEVLTKVPIVQGLLPVSMINQVSELSFVRYIRLPDYGFKSTGSVDSQGDHILQAAQARAQFGVDGTGIRVGVISDGIGGIFAAGCTSCGPTSAFPSPIASRDLPGATGTRNSSGVLISSAGSISAKSFRADGDLEACLGACDTASLVGAEGTAMLEIVHDLAPGAKLFFANFDTSMSFSQAVDFLAANTDIAVDDIGFFTPPFDGTSDVSTSTANSLNTDSNPIRSYFTAVANVAQDHYGGMYLDSGKNGKSITGQAGGLHVFQAMSGVTVDNENVGSSVTDPATIPPLGEIIVLLTWNDPANTSSNDYDLFLVPLSCSGFARGTGLPVPPCSISGPPLASSTNPQTGTQPPVEELIFENPSASFPIAVGIVIQNANNAAAVRTFDLFVLGSLADGAIPDHNFVTVSGSVPAESDAGGSPVSVISVGAIDQTQCSDSGNCNGSVEPYSSQGPTEATPQADSRMKPDVTATDDVSVTGAGGFGLNGSNTTATGGCTIGESPCFFAGTSAAAPHAAAVAALVLQTMSSSTAGQSPATVRTNLRNFLTSTSVPLPGVSQAIPNNIEGFGLLDGLAAVTAAKGLPSGSFSLTSNPASISIAAAGQAGTSTITLTGTDGFTGTVSFSCSVSPVPVNDPPTCFVSPSSAVLDATTTSASVAVRISTTAGLNSAVLPHDRSNGFSYAAFSAAFPIISIFLVRIKRRPSDRVSSLALLALVGLAISLSCCAGNGGSNQIDFGTPPGSYTASIVGSSGAAVQTTSVSFILQ
jgi:hypothetical protein